MTAGQLQPGDRVVIAGEARVVVEVRRGGGRLYVEHRGPTVASDAATGVTAFEVGADVGVRLL